VAVRFVGPEKITADSYAAYLRAHRSAVRSILASHIRTANGSDPFEIAGAVKDLTAAIDAKDVDALATAHNAFNERLDAHLTMLVRP
jgi:hypothetical protein